jgi:hypothetical protein
MIPALAILKARRQAGESRHDDADLGNPKKERRAFHSPEG